MRRKFTLDKINRFIISELQRNGRTKLTELAKKLKVTPAAVKERLERLIEKKVIRITTLINPENSISDFYYPICAIIGIEADSECISILTKKLNDCPLVLSMQKTAGMHNLIITMAGKDLSILEKRINDHIRSEPGIKHVEVNIGKFYPYQFIPLKIQYPIAKDLAPCGVAKNSEIKCKDCLAFLGEKKLK